MKQKVIRVHPSDNVLVALTDLRKGDAVSFDEDIFTLTDDVPAKHKFVMHDMAAGDAVVMYGVVVGKVQEALLKGARLTTTNLKHAAEPFRYRKTDYQWKKPDASRFRDMTFMGYHRSNGEVGTANYWLFIPTVFCENRNLDVIREAMHNELGYAVTGKYKSYTRHLLEAFHAGVDFDDLRLDPDPSSLKKDRPFKNIDGIKFLNHQGGCGGIRQDAAVLSTFLRG